MSKINTPELANVALDEVAQAFETNKERMTGAQKQCRGNIFMMMQTLMPLVVQYLCHNYVEYKRKPQGPFRKLVQRAIEVVRDQGGRVEQGVQRKRAGPESTDDSDSQASGSGGDGAVESAAPKGFNMMNSSLLSQYKQRVTSTASPSERVADKSAASTPTKNIVAAKPSAEAMESPAPASAASGSENVQKESKETKEGGDSGPIRQPAKRQRVMPARPVQSKSEGEGKGKSAISEIPSVRYADVGGIEHILQEVREQIEYPLTHPEIYAHLGVQPPRGVLLHGPPGCGKTLLARAIAGELQCPFIQISAPEIVSGMSGESEAKIRNLFEEAKTVAPSLIFIDEIDAITPKRETAQREMERRIVAQLLTCMDDLAEIASVSPVMVIGATNRADSIDPALRRSGRFDREIALGIPDEQARGRILRVFLQRLRLSGDFDIAELARRTPGYVGADLSALTKEAAVMAVNRIFQSLSSQLDKASAASTSAGAMPLLPSDPRAALATSAMDVELNATPSAVTAEQAQILVPADVAAAMDASGVSLEHRQSVVERLRALRVPLTEEQLAPLSIRMSDFEEAVKKVQPSAKREGFATTPDVSWADIGALETVRKDMEMAVLYPIRYPERFQAMNVSVSGGVLMFGPPGCGKTLLAKAIASESGASFISVKGPELLNKYVGESERAVRQVFERARASAPCVVFFDEMDALCPQRGMDSSNASTERVVNQLLTEMDGVDSRKQVFVIAATNRPDMIDQAMLRPGRLGKKVYVGLPSPDEREQILKTLTRKTPLERDVDLHAIATSDRCARFSGADLANLATQAATIALWDSFQADHSKAHFNASSSARAVPKTATPASTGTTGLASDTTTAPATITDNAKQSCSVTHQHFMRALDVVRPSVSHEEQLRNERLAKELITVPSRS